MTMIRRKIPWTSQPQGPVEVDLGNPLVNTATDVFNGSTHSFNAARTRLESVSGEGSGYSIAPGRHGQGIWTPNGGWVNYALNRSWNGASTIYALVHLTSVDNPWGGLFSKDATGTFAEFAVGRANDGDNLYAAINNNGSYNNPYTISGSSITALLGSPHVLAFVFDPTTQKTEYYVDGVYVGITIAMGTQVAAATGPLGLGRSADNSASYDSNCIFYNFTRCPVVHNAAQVAKTSENIWQIFAPQTRNVWVPVAGGAVTETLTTSSLNFTPQDTQNLQALTLSAAALNFTPQDISPATSVALSTAVLSFTLQDIQNLQTLTLSVAALNFTPQDITAENGASPVVVTLDAASLSFASQDIQNAIRIPTGVAALNTTAQDVQNVLLLGTSEYALTFTPQSIQQRLITNIDPAAFNFVPQPIDVTGTLASGTGASKMLMGLGY